MSEAAALDVPATDGSDARILSSGEGRGSLAGLCREIIELMDSIGLPDDRYNEPKTAHMSEPKDEVTCECHVDVVDQLEDLAKAVAARSAVSDGDLVAKFRVFDSLTVLALWNDEALQMLRKSIDKDCKRMARQLHDLSFPGTFKTRWLTRQFSVFSRSAR